jgi:hypothetical protein
VYGILLPEVTEMVSFKTTKRFGALAAEQLSGGGPTLGQMVFGDGIGLVHGQHGADGAGGAEGLLSFEALGSGQGFCGEDAGLIPVRAGFGLEALETVLAIEPFPAA